MLHAHQQLRTLQVTLPQPLLRHSRRLLSRTPQEVVAQVRILGGWQRCSTLVSERDGKMPPSCRRVASLAHMFARQRADSLFHKFSDARYAVAHLGSSFGV